MSTAELSYRGEGGISLTMANDGHHRHATMPPGSFRRTPKISGGGSVSKQKKEKGVPRRPLHSFVVRPAWA